MDWHKACWDFWHVHVSVNRDQLEYQFENEKRMNRSQKGKTTSKKSASCLANRAVIHLKLADFFSEFTLSCAMALL
jgi:hypothetical protein